MKKKWYTILVKIIRGGKMVSDDKKRFQISLSKQSMRLLEEKSKETGFTKSVIIELALSDYFLEKEKKG